eukprot:1747300-Prorocentrum_lima.AAC.1
MTSSLVGSEMCIRDRPWPAGSYRQVLAGKTLADKFKLCFLGFKADRKARACLLYTSDAADDM